MARKKIAKKKKTLRKPRPKRVARSLPDTPKVEKRKKASVRKVMSAKTPSNYLVRVNEVRRAAYIDYVTDSEARSIDHWHGRKDRPYSRLVALKTFRMWGREDGWVDRRETYWAEITEKVVRERQKQVFMAGLEELKKLTIAHDYMGEYLMPLFDDAGNVRRHKEGDLKGLPIMPLKLPDMDKYVKMCIHVEKHLMLKRGEATTRHDSMDAETKVKVTSLDPVAQKISLDRGDVRAMAQLMLERRQPQLVAGDGDVIDVKPEDYDDEDKPL